MFLKNIDKKKIGLKAQMIMNNMDVNPTDKVLSAYLYMETKNAT